MPELLRIKKVKKEEEEEVGARNVLIMMSN